MNTAPRSGWLNQPVSRAGCLGGCAVWLLVMLLPAVALWLAAGGQLEWRRGPLASDRLWLIQTDEQAGLAYAAARVTRDERAAGGPICARTRVLFLFWRGAGEPADYCECYQFNSTGLTPTGACP